MAMALVSQQALALDFRIEIDGLDRAQEANVRAFLKLERERANPDISLARLRLLHDQAPEQIREALRPFGLFRPAIDAELRKDADTWIALYRVDPGPAVKLATVDFVVSGEGRSAAVFDTAPPFMAGDDLDQAAYDTFKNRMLDRALAQGYLDARYTRSEIRVDLESYQADIHLHLDTGKNYRFGEVSYRQDLFAPEFLARYQSFQAGDPFNQDALLKLQSDLLDSEYFSQVEVKMLRDQATGDQVPVEAMLSPAKPNRYRVGLGFSTDEGPRATLDWQRRYLGDEGHNIFSQLKVSEPSTSLTSEYRVPLQRPTKDQLTFSFAAESYQTDTSEGKQLDLGVTQSVGLGGGWRRTLGLDYSYEDYRVDDVQDEANLLIPSVQWAYLWNEGKGFSLQGHRFEVGFLGAAEPLLSSTSFIQVLVRDRWILSLGENWRLLTRAQLGATLAEDLDRLPASKRFFAGGDNSLRGFALDELGPTDEQNDVIGGRMLAVGSLEIQRRLTNDWAVSTFYDTGNAFDPDYDNAFAQSIGFGVRWQSPIGPVRLDVASAISEDGNPLRLHIVVGPEL